MRRTLRNLMLLLMFPIVIFLANGCSKSDPAPEVPVTKFDPISFLVNDLGFNKNDIVETDTTYEVEKCMSYYKDNFEKLYVSEGLSGVDAVQERTHRRTTRQLKFYDLYTINVPPAVPSAWRTNIITAMNNWNALYAPTNQIYLVYTSQVNNYPGGMNVVMQNLNPGTFGTTDPPAYPGNIGTYMRLNQTFNGSSAQRIWGISHEFGHAIGLAHSNTLEGILLGLPSPCSATDVNSVMRPGAQLPGNVLPNWSGFSNCDKEAYKKICAIRKNL